MLSKEPLISNAIKLFCCVAIVLLTSCSDSEDKDRIAQLTLDGIRVQDRKVEAWFPKDSLSASRMREIIDTLNLGISFAQQFIKAPQAWQQFPEGTITYYFVPGNFVSHTTDKNEILIPLWRINTSKAPWLHETMHILYRSKKGNWNEASKINTYFNRPLWLAEGLADYSAFKISNQNQIPIFDVQGMGGYAKMDSVCETRLDGSKGQYILTYIGKEGLMSELFGEDRREYAPAFYTCSCSFTKYLSETYGLETMVLANSEFEDEHETIEKLTGKRINILKKEWLGNLHKE